jgi:hypothetical protein
MRFGSGTEASLAAELLGCGVHPVSAPVTATDVQTVDVDDGWFLRARVLSERLPDGASDLE